VRAVAREEAAARQMLSSGAMKTTVLASLLLIGSGVFAFADAPPRGPDFVSAMPPRGVDRSLAASDGTAPIAPVDVVMFGSESDVLISSAITQIDTAAKWLRANPKFQIVLEGHTDRGAESYIDDVAVLRAQAVRNRLLSDGIPSDRIVLVVFGAVDATWGINPNDRRVVMYASDRATKTIVAGSLGPRHARVALWTRNGTMFQEQRSDEPTREAITLRP
jgi:flagellar motor protein MotB